jgi:hypothetical protein
MTHDNDYDDVCIECREKEAAEIESRKDDALDGVSAVFDTYLALDSDNATEVGLARRQVLWAALSCELEDCCASCRAAFAKMMMKELAKMRRLIRHERYAH